MKMFALMTLLLAAPAFGQDDDGVIETITFDQGMVAHEVGSYAAAFAEDATRTYAVLNARYPMSRFTWQLRDVEGRPMCMFVMEDDDVSGGCVDVVRP